MKALILAAGYATRLYPLTKEYPKPLLKVKGKPIIDYIVEKLLAIEDIDEIFVVTNSKFISHFRAWKRKHIEFNKIKLIDDLTKTNADRLGAIGDLNLAIQKEEIDDDLLVIGGDNLFDDKLDSFRCFIKKHKDNPVIGAHDIMSLKDASRYGIIKIDKNNKIIDFKEKPSKPNSTLVAMCLYYFPKEKIFLIKEYLVHKKSKKDATGLYIDWLRKKVLVFGFIFRGNWFDIGEHKYYNKAKGYFAS